MPVSVMFSGLCGAAIVALARIDRRRLAILVEQRMRLDFGERGRGRHLQRLVVDRAAGSAGALAGSSGAQR